MVKSTDSGEHRLWSQTQFSRSVVSDSLGAHESQHARPRCPSPTPGCCCCCYVTLVVSDSVRPHRWQPTRLPFLGILQARTLEWVAISFSSAWKWKVKWSCSVVSDSSRPHGLQPTRLFCPWDFPGKSTGVGCHCLLRPTPGVHPNSCLLSQWCHPTSHVLSSHSPPAFNLAHHQDLFKWVSSLYQVAKVLEFQHQSFQWIFRTDFL